MQALFLVLNTMVQEFHQNSKLLVNFGIRSESHQYATCTFDGKKTVAIGNKTDDKAMISSICVIVLEIDYFSVKRKRQHWYIDEFEV